MFEFACFGVSQLKNHQHKFKQLLPKVVLAEQFGSFSHNIWIFYWLLIHLIGKSAIYPNNNMNWLAFAFLWRCMLDVQNQSWRNRPNVQQLDFWTYFFSSLPRKNLPILLITCLSFQFPASVLLRCQALTFIFLYPKIHTYTFHYKPFKNFCILFLSLQTQQNCFLRNSK